VLIDYAKKSVKLTTLEGKELEYVIEPMITAKGVANRLKPNQLDVSQGPMVPVVNDPMSSPRNCQVCNLIETLSL
jgi:hypothetical protein